MPRKNRAFKSLYSVFIFCPLGFIYSLGLGVLDSVLETPEIREALAKKIDAMTAAEKIKMIETLVK